MSKVRKAVVAGVVAVAAVVPLALEDGSLSKEELLNLIAAAVVAGYAVWRVPNEPELIS